MIGDALARSENFDAIVGKESPLDVSSCASSPGSLADASATAAERTRSCASSAYAVFLVSAAPLGDNFIEDVEETQHEA